MRILFLTRVHPPIIGGLENQSFNLVNNFKKINEETFVIANTKGKKALPYFLPFAYLKALKLIKKNKITHLHLSDGVMAVIGDRLRRKTGIKTIITIHGLDITYQKKFYQKYIPKKINKLDKVICISENTKKECIKRGISKKKIVVIPNGVNTSEFYINEPRSKLRKRLEGKIKISLKDKKILLTTGRLVKRKGVEWFVDKVMPKLPNKYIYLISGDGEEEDKIKQAVKKNNLEGKVILLGRTDFEVLKLLYNSADLFIMPNISVKGNVEGFGLVAIEAGSCGLPVVASNVDGIPAAIIEGKTGWLIKEKDVNGFVKKIKGKMLKRERVRKEVKKNFDWEKIVKRYQEVMR